MRTLKIHLEELEDGPRHLVGELDKEVFDLPKGDAEAVSPLSYDLEVSLFEQELFVSGKIFSTFQFECVRSLKRFAKTLTIDPFELALDTKGKQVIDITEELREELILAFPSYPRCEEGDSPESSEINSSYLRVDKHPQERVNNSCTDRNNEAWDVLDSLSTQSDDAVSPQ